MGSVTTTCTGGRRSSSLGLMVTPNTELTGIIHYNQIIIIGGNWKFGLKDLAISSGKTGISTRYPLEGKDYFHANNCDTHNAYHQVLQLGYIQRTYKTFKTKYDEQAMTKGAKMLEKEPQPKTTGGWLIHYFNYYM